MARKNVLSPQTIASSQSLASAFGCTPTELSFLDNIAYQIEVSTTNSSGQFVLQATLDSPDSLGSFASVNWTTLMNCGAITGANDSILVNVNQFPYKYARLYYTPSVAGTGTCSIKIMAKQIGG